MVKCLGRNLDILAAREAGEAIEEIARRHNLTAARVAEIIRFEKLRRELCPAPVYRALCRVVAD